MAPMPTPRIDTEVREFTRPFELPSVRFGEVYTPDVPVVNPEAIDQDEVRERRPLTSVEKRRSNIALSASGVFPPTPRLETL